MVSLVLEKEYSAISIKDITDRAEVAYITFFRHYDGIDELLMEVLDEGLAELLRHIATLAGEADGPANELEGKLIFEYIKIEWWLEHKMSPPPLQMGKIYKALIIDSTRDTVIAL